MSKKVIIKTESDFLSAEVARSARLVEMAFDHLLPECEISTGKDRIVEAMRYSLLSGGKRLRPFLTICSSKLFGVQDEVAVLVAAAIEMIHTYSIIHDDLPALDDDDMRRDQPSCHVMYDEATAILAGDALLSLAFETLSSDKLEISPHTKIELVSLLATISGYKGMVTGQMMDLIAKNVELNYEEVIRMQRMKTAELFAACCEAGAILGRGSTKTREYLRRYALELGLVFQITDDILDVTEDNRKDSSRKKTLIDFIGVDRAAEHAKMIANQGLMYLDIFDDGAELLRELMYFILNRIE